MKQIFLGLFTLCCLLAPASSAIASVSRTSQEMRTEMVNNIRTHGLDKQKMGLLKKGKGLFKKMSQVLALRRAADLGGINDPVDKWLWIGLILIGISILAGVILGELGFLLGLLGVVSLIVWLVKKAEL